MTVTRSSWDARCLKALLLDHIVFFVGNIWATHHRCRRSSNTWVLCWMLLVAFQGKRT